MNQDTQQRIAQLRQQWKAQREQEERQRREREAEYDRELSARAKRALENGWVPGPNTPCDCDQFLINILEGRSVRCPHYNGAYFYKFLEQAGF